MPEIIETPLDERIYQKHYSEFAPWRGAPLSCTGYFLVFLWDFVRKISGAQLPFAVLTVAFVIYFIGFFDIVINMFRYQFSNYVSDERTYTVLPWKGKKVFFATVLFYGAYFYSNDLPKAAELPIPTATVILSSVSLAWYYVYALRILRSQKQGGPAGKQ